MNSSLNILVAAPESRDSAALISQIDEDFGIRASLATTIEELSAHLHKRKPDIIVVETGGNNREFNLSLVQDLRKSLPETIILAMIPTSRREMLATLIKIDVSYYIHTPIERAETRLIFNRAVQHISLNPASSKTQADRAAITQQSVQNIDWSRGMVNFNDMINELETELIVQALSRSRGNKKEAARLLNLKRTTLLEKIKKKDINNTTE